MAKTKATAPFSTVLVATDFTEGGAISVERALALPLAAGATVEILHVAADGGSAKARAEVAARAKQALADELVRAQGRYPGVNVVTKQLRGEPYVEIIRRARELEAEVVVVGRHGRRPIRDLFVGSTAARIIRMGDTPVLVTRTASTQPYRRPMIASDLGDVARRLFELALRVSGPITDGRVVHAFHVPFEGFMASSRTARDELRRSYAATAREKLAALVAPYQDAARWSTAAVVGDARIVIPVEAAKRGSDVLVIGTHGRSGIAHKLLGSVAESVIASAPCDVLVSRPVRFTFEMP
jgi:nucleotide-binding universal stress UspA family protein